MGTDQVAFAVVLPEVTCPLRKYVLHMRNRKLRNIRPSVAFSPEVTSVTRRTGSGPVRKYVLRMLGFPRVFFFVVQ